MKIIFGEFGNETNIFTDNNYADFYDTDFGTKEACGKSRYEFGKLVFDDD